MRKFKQIVKIFNFSIFNFSIFILFLGMVNVAKAQTTIISGTGAGSFEGASFLADGWITVMGATPTHNNLALGNAATIGFTPTDGTKGVFVTNNGTTRGYAHTSSWAWIYRDVTLPAGETKATFTMDLFGNPGDLGFDGVVVGITDQTYTASLTTGATGTMTGSIVPGMTIATSATANSFIEDGNYGVATTRSYNISPASMGNSVASSTRRIWIGWRCDGSAGNLTTPLSFDKVSFTTALPINYVSAATGNWSAAATWTPSGIPTAGDNVTIADGHTVTIDATATATCNNLTVGEGASGVLIFNSATARTITVGGNLNIAAGGTFQSAASGTVTTHALSIAGNITNSGTLDFSTNSNTAGAGITFTGSANQLISGTGATTDLFSLTMSKSALANLVDFNVSNFSVRGLSSSAVGALLTSNSGTGTIKFSGSNTFSGTLWSAAGYTIPSTLGFWLNNANFTVQGQNGSPTNSGLFRITAGTLNVGTGTNANSFQMGSGSTNIIEGGTINTNARFAVSGASNSITYTQSGGTIICGINPSASGNASTTIGNFDLGTSTSSIITISGGTVIIRNRSAAGSGPRELRGAASGATINITGGNIQIGDASTQVTPGNFIIQGILPSLTINSTNNPGVSQTSAVELRGDLTLNGTGTYTNNSTALTIRGNSVANPGNLTINTGSVFTINSSNTQTLTFSSSFGNQTLTNSGTITSSQLPSLTVNNTFSGGTVTIPTGLSLMGGSTLTLTSGVLTVGGAGAITFIQAGAGTATFAMTRTNGSISATSTAFGVASPTTLNYNYNTSATGVTTGLELPTTVGSTTPLTTLTINNASGVTLDKPVLVGTLTLTAGKLNTTTTNLVTVTGTTVASVARTSGYVSGPIARTLPASLTGTLTYNLPVGKATYNPIDIVNPTTTSGGSLVINAEAFDANAGGTAGTNMGSLNTDRYWAASITSGAGNFTSTFVRLTDASSASSSAIASSASLSGTYDIVGGTSPTVVVGTSVTSVAPAATTLPGFYVLGTKAVNMAYTSSTTTQTITTSVPQNTTNAQIIGIQVVTSGNSSPINATSFTFNANGTTDINDITNAKLYYTGISSTFATTTLVGTAIPTIAAYQIVGTQTLAEGINYFWLTYDISPTAVVNNVIDGECTVVQVASVDNTPTVTAPSGTRTIVVGAVTTFPFNDDFETGDLNKWITVNGSQTNKWHAGPATNNGGSNASYISNNSGTSNAYTTTSTSVVHFYRDITFPASGSYRLKFDWKGNGEPSWDDLRVFFIDVTTTPVAGTSLSSGQIGSNYVSQSSWQSVDLAFPSGYLGTTKRLVFSWRNDDITGTQPPAALDNISVYLEQDMVYSSSNVTQSVTTSVNAASTNQQVIGIQVVTTGSLNPLTLSKLVLNATGTTSASDIANAKIFYTGVSSTFATTTQFGSTIATPTTTNFDVTGTQILAQGTNYFWLTYDINATAIHNNVVDGECVSITVAGTDYTPTTTAPSGSRSILNKTLTSVAGIQASSATLLQGSVNQQVLRLDFVVAGPSGGSLLLNSLDATYTGTLASDIATNGVKLFTTTTTTFSTTTPLGTAQSISGGIASFTGLNFNLPIGTSYVWVAFDINPGATINNIVDTKIAINGINVGGATFNGSEIDPAGSRTIRGPLVGDYFVGAGEVAPNYVTLTAAISDLNALGVSGSVRFLLKNTTYNTASGEVFPLVINSITGASAINTITIQPNAGVASSISGTSGVSASALIRLNGADYVTIDGINSGGSSLLIENTSITGGTAVIWVSSAGVGAGATNNQVKNCTIKAGLANTANLTTNTYGIVICGSTLSSTHTSITAGADNDNNTISGNNIIKARYGIYSIGASAANANTGTVINNNIIGPAAFGADAIGRGGIVVREEDGIQITGNEIRFVGGDFANATSGIDRVGITFGTDASWTATSVFVKNAVVSKNILHDIVDERTFSAAAISIAAADGANPTNNTIANNFIFNVKANGTSGDQTVGIGLTAGNGDRVVFNSIYLTGDTDPNASATAPTVSNFGISISSGTAVTNPLLRNNIVYMDLTSSSTTTLKNAAINVPTSYIWGTGNSNYNDLYILPANTQSNIGCIGGSGGTFHATLAAWQSAVSQDANSVNIAPDFTSSIDLHLTIANPSLDNAATPIVGLTKDIDDNDRNTTTPDIGADEFKSCATVTSSDDSGSGTLRAAITCVAENGKVFYDQPTTTTTILTAPLTIDKNVTIQGLSDVARPEITTDPAAASGIIINVDKTLTLQNVDIKSTNPAQTFSGAGNVSITGLTISKP